jgi:cytochrome P450 monooxygenase
MVDILRRLRLRLQWYKYLFLFRHQSWLGAVQAVHNYINKHIDSTFKELEEMEAMERLKTRINPEEATENTKRTDLLWFMASRLRDKVALRSQICLIFVPNNDTTSIFISHILWNLARYPVVYAKCCTEIEALGDSELTFETLRGLKYLQAVLDESE